MVSTKLVGHETQKDLRLIHYRLFQYPPGSDWFNVPDPLISLMMRNQIQS